MASLKEQLVAILEKAGYLSQYPGTMARILMENGVVIPVRCKDCRYCQSDSVGLWCFNDYEHNLQPDDYCSYGERRTND